MVVTFDQLSSYSYHVLVDGAFDPLHSGHISYLNAARALNKGPLLCAVAPDDQIRAKGREPLLPQESRVKVLEALCDVVYAKDRPTEQVIEKMAPRAYVKGMDWEDKLPPEQVSACVRMGTEFAFVDTPTDSSTARLRAWARADEAKHLEAFERIVQSQKPASVPWQPVTDYSFEARKEIEGKHPELIKEVFQPECVLDCGCGPDAILVRLLRELGVRARGYDPLLRSREYGFRGSLLSPYAFHNVGVWFDDASGDKRNDLVICREVLEHLTIRQLRVAVANLCTLSSRFVYVTTRFAKDHAHLLSVDTSDDLDPTHISMMNQSLLRLLFVLEGFVRRPDLETRMDWMQKGRVLVYERTQ